MTPQKNLFKNLCQLIKNNPQTMLLLGALSLLLRLLSTVLLDDKYVWQTIDFFSMFSTFLFASGSFFYIPYRHKKVKCITALAAATSFFEAIFTVGFYCFNLIMPVVFAIWFYAFVWLTIGICCFVRSYESKTIPVNKAGLYLLQKKPSSIQDVFISLCCRWGSDAGFAWYDNRDNIFYGYRKGVFIALKTDFDIIRLTHNPVVYYGDDEIIKSKLDNAIGRKWNIWKSNCLFIKTL